MHKSSRMTLLVTLACGTIAAGCASSGSNERAYAGDYANYGTIQSIEQVSPGGGSTVAGTLTGAAIGGVVGHQFGSGRGNDAATVAGAIGGAIVGHEIQENAQERQADQNSYRIQVRMRRGGMRTVTASDASNLRVGQEVRVEGNRIQA
jgi:outer membrane lipoprotein SlyB